MIAFITGLLAVAWLPSLLYTPLLLTFAFLAMLRQRWRRLAILLSLGVLFGSIWGAWQLNHRLPDRFARTDVNLVGIIDQLPRLQGRRQSFTLRIISIDSADEALLHLRRLSLSHYDAHDLLKAGDRIKVRVRLFPPRGLSNPYAFDSERRFLTESIDARGYVRSLDSIESSGITLPGLRQRLSMLLDQYFDERVSVTLRALVLGDRSGLSPEQWRLLSETGTAHLLVVSGVHIAVMAGLGVLATRTLGLLLLWGGGSSRDVRRAGLLLTLLLACAYALLAGMGLPVQRALIMVAVFIGAEWWLRPVTAWQRWRIALLGVCLLQPLAVIEPGAWLSFGAVALLIWISQQGTRLGGLLSRWWGVQGRLFIGMMPISALLFHQLGFLAPLVNFVALPAVSLLVMALPVLLPLVLLGVQWPADLLSWVILAFWQGVTLSREGLGLYLALPDIEPLAMLLAIVAVLWWLLPLPLRWRWLSIFMLFPMLATEANRPPEGTFVATLFDVGQGLAVLIETSEGRIIYDTGPGYSGGGSAFDYAVAPALKARRLSTIEQVVISHGDSDHSGGFGALRREYVYQQLILGQPLQGVAGGINCADHPQVTLGGVRFRYLQSSMETLSNDNAHSCVLIVESRHCVLVIPGDLEMQGEMDLMRRYDLPRTDWLVAGHHGSKTSSSAAWLDALQPTAVLFSRGAFNRFGHPAAEVVERVSQRGALIHDTASDGALLLEAGEECRTSAWRQRKKRYWTAG
ncbi:DNA internalization-related competence protein ComEC/Rec2 [Marinobacterium zhoushanense]|uniref:DNA internalization-related competence protein ComEC/Rec2 n=1 Tax=Marinobacterium zhoushanense TaxID=1679163 RepID=A0ABQ1KLK8_9GAMM|nr:DNA internalization-related competence protein ComEC/Rec2 [Marinobacterium zhoushanense]GGC02968.1 DNA internalization-related competence protein ComEC/Rec2 [Marinobacterium zhoushanense]